MLVLDHAQGQDTKVISTNRRNDTKVFVEQIKRQIESEKLKLCNSLVLINKRDLWENSADQIIFTNFCENMGALMNDCFEHESPTLKKFSNKDVADLSEVKKNIRQLLDLVEL